VAGNDGLGGGIGGCGGGNAGAWPLDLPSGSTPRCSPYTHAGQGMISTIIPCTGSLSCPLLRLGFVTAPTPIGR
jgi:hypothetical protein